MGRHYYRNYSRYYDDFYDDEDFNDRNIENFIGPFVVVGLLLLVNKYYTNRAQFWQWLIYGVILITLSTGVCILILKIRQKRRRIIMGIKNINSNVSKTVQEAAHDKAVEKTSHVTPQANLLYNALIKRGIKCETEKWDGHKHIDIAIPWAKINIEIDGTQHYTDPKQMVADYQRTYYSSRKGFGTIRLPNFIIDQDVEIVADNIAQTARGKYFRSRSNF